MEGEKEASHWKAVGHAQIARPTKLIDGSRGGQAFICSLLRPKDNQRYPIGKQARAQLQSMILVVAGMMNLEATNSTKGLEQALREDFEFSDRLGVVFKRLFPTIVALNFLFLILLVVVCYSLWGTNLFGQSSPYVIKICSFALWIVGATGLLMMGGNPRVKIVSHEIPQFVEERIYLQSRKGSTSESDSSDESTDDLAKPFERLQIEFGSVHGSVFTPDYGTCTVPLDVVRAVCSWDIEFSRTWRWFLGTSWFGLMLLCSIVLQVAGIKRATLWSEVLGVVLLLVTSVLRGLGISGREEWLIPRWKSRAHYGATLQGVLESRNYSV